VQQRLLLRCVNQLALADEGFRQNKLIDPLLIAGFDILIAVGAIRQVAKTAGNVVLIIG